MTQETLELVTKLANLKKIYETLLNYANGVCGEPIIAIGALSKYKKNKFGADQYDFALFYDDKEVIEIIKDHCNRKINEYQKEIESI